MKLLQYGTLLAVLAACGGGEDGAATSAGEAAAAPFDRDVWWSTATRRPSGAERILAPRELRALLAEGQARGLPKDSEWWQPRAKWAYERILTMDPEDVEANEGSGRRTLQSMEGFADLWRRMLAATVANEALTELIDRYGVAVEENRPVFLFASEWEQVRGRFLAVKRHLDRLDRDPDYAAAQRALASARTSHLGDFPSLHLRVGPFLLFYSARDLQRIPGEDPVTEDRRLEERRATYKSRLEKWTEVYTELVADLQKLYPEVWKDYGVAEGVLFKQWIFADRAAYVDLVQRLRADGLRRPYRHGFFHPSTGWAYMVEPAAPEGGTAPSLAETAAYLAAQQILRHWAQDPDEPLVNHLDRSQAYWFKEGWPSFLAARRVKAPAVGPLLERAKRSGLPLPEIIRVFERRSANDPPSFTVAEAGGEPGTFRPGEGGGFTDLACLVVAHLHQPKHKPNFVRYLRSRLDGSRRGIDWFEECFGVKGAGWRNFEAAVYRDIETGR